MPIDSIHAVRRWAPDRNCPYGAEKVTGGAQAEMDKGVPGMAHLLLAPMAPDI